VSIESPGVGILATEPLCTLNYGSNSKEFGESFFYCIKAASRNATTLEELERLAVDLRQALVVVSMMSAAMRIKPGESK
jgi:hypothetical protein